PRRHRGGREHPQLARGRQPAVDGRLRGTGRPPEPRLHLRRHPHLRDGPRAVAVPRGAAVDRARPRLRLRPGHAAPPHRPRRRRRRLASGDRPPRAARVRGQLRPRAPREHAGRGPGRHPQVRRRAPRPRPRRGLRLPAGRMKAARYLGPGSLAIEDVPVPTIADGEVLVRVRACGVCGTDVKTYVRGHARIRPGSVLGHEVAGEVVESRHPRFAAGQRVALGPYAPCGRCASCRRGRYSLCSDLGAAFAEPGGFAEYVKVPERLADLVMFAIPDSMSFELASLAEPLACCVHGLEALDLPEGGSLLVIGDGPMGLMQAAIAPAFGAGRVVVAGATPHRLAHAAGFVHATVDVTATPLVEAARELFPDGPDA